MKKRGKGIAAMFYPIGFTSYPNPGAAFVKVNQDGTAILYVGAPDIGQGSNTIMAQIAAEELGIGLDNVTVVAADTKLTPFDFGSVASRVTYIVGNAVQKAAAQAKQILLEVAAEDLKVSATGLVAGQGYIYVEGFPEQRIEISAVALPR
jgi:CO/xanthine dehydrogenase Mo-binding subunit